MQTRYCCSKRGNYSGLSFRHGGGIPKTWLTSLINLLHFCLPQLPSFQATCGIVAFWENKSNEIIDSPLWSWCADYMFYVLGLTPFNAFALRCDYWILMYCQHQTLINIFSPLSDAGKEGTLKHTACLGGSVRNERKPMWKETKMSNLDFHARSHMSRSPEKQKQGGRLETDRDEG